MAFNKEAESVLVLNEVYVSNASFRSDFYETLETNKDNKKKFSFHYDFKPNNESIHVLLGVSVTLGQHTTKELCVEICGVFSILNDAALSDELIHHLITKNTIVILFPFLRTFVFNLSSMTSLGSVNIPIFDINKAIDPPERQIEENN